MEKDDSESTTPGTLDEARVAAGQEPQEPQGPQKPVVSQADPSPDLFDRVYDAATVSTDGATMGQEIVPRRKITFDVDGQDCAPGMFVDRDGASITFRLTLATLTAAQEIKVTRGINDPAEAVQLTAKAAIDALNGKSVPNGAKLDFLWEALGPGGRQLVLMMYQEIGALTPAGLGKAQAGSTRG